MSISIEDIFYNNPHSSPRDNVVMKEYVYSIDSNLKERVRNVF
jgi:hypothetical protein